VNLPESSQQKWDQSRRQEKNYEDEKPDEITSILMLVNTAIILPYNKTMNEECLKSGQFFIGWFPIISQQNELLQIL
jgi:hypothetical protein